jgi:ABC-type Fe3+-hydroxamate transport system substrate-binding protein
MSKRLGAAILTGAIAVLVLTGCAGGGASEEQVSEEATAFTITTPSGRVVECIDYNGGLSCDWERTQ